MRCLHALDLILSSEQSGMWVLLRETVHIILKKEDKEAQNSTWVDSADGKEESRGSPTAVGPSPMGASPPAVLVEDRPREESQEGEESLRIGCRINSHGKDEGLLFSSHA